MTTRNNQSRVAAPEIPQQQQKNILEFVAPTQFVELPSQGLYYSPEHPLYNKEHIEVRYMSAKDEDILSSQNLIKKGVAIDRFLENVLMDKSFPIDSLLISDKNAILIAARSSGYGSAYETSIACPSCGAKTDDVFDLENPNIYYGGESEDVQKTERGTYKVKLPISKMILEFRLLTSKDEKKIVKKMSDAAKKNFETSTVTDQYKLMTVSVNEVTDSFQIANFIDIMPIADSSALREAYKKVSPSVEIKKQFECNSCGHEQELEVPFGADFFWPKR